MKKYNIDDYDLFIFDFDGTIMDTECYHYKSYLSALKHYNENINLTINEFFKLVHNTDKTDFHKLLERYKIHNYEEFYAKKSEFYKNNIINNKINYIGNVDKFIKKLKNKNKKFIIVTNSSIKSLEVFKEMYPILNLFDKIFTKEDFNKKKPDPECYLKIQDLYQSYKMIGFEDSNPGSCALSYATNIKPIHIKTPDYYYNDYIKNKYNFEIIDNYDCFD